MTEQLRLTEAPPAGSSNVSWRLDEQTKRIGRRGIAQARANLATARTPVALADADTEAGRRGPQRHAA